MELSQVKPEITGFNGNNGCKSNSDQPWGSVFLLMDTE